MTNSKLLKQKIRESGLKMIFIAQYVGISRCALYNKINNLRPFTQYEIAKMCLVLKIDELHEKEAIFFAHDVN